MKIEVTAVLQPTQKLKNSIWNLMKIISRKYKTFHDIRKAIGPHITVINFEYIDHNNLQKILERVNQICRETTPFIVELSNVDYFTKVYQKDRTPYVIFLRVRKSKPLALLNKKLEREISNFGKTKSNYFIPHLTLAHGDLSKQNFYKARRDLKNLTLHVKFTARNLKVLILRKGRQKWEIVKISRFRETK